MDGDLRDGDLRDGDLRDGDLRDGGLGDGDLGDAGLRGGESISSIRFHLLMRSICRCATARRFFTSESVSA